MRKVLYILGELSDSDIEWLIATGRKEQLEAGAVLIYQDKPIDAVYIVLDGSLSVGTGRGDREIARLGAGEMVGEMSFIDARPPSATVTALEKSVVLAVPRQLLVSKLEQDAGFAARFYRALAIFLSNRLRGMVSQYGYGTEQQVATDLADELDANILDNVYLAGSRFDHLLKRLLAS